MAKKKKAKPIAASERSKIIEQCVIYVQCLAAYPPQLYVEIGTNPTDSGSVWRQQGGPF